LTQSGHLEESVDYPALASRLSMRLRIASKCIGLAAVAPLILHGHAAPDCNPRISLCALSDAMYLPDDPAPDPVPQLILAPPVAGSTVSLSSDAMIYR
jgi:hypothetical protein